MDLLQVYFLKSNGRTSVFKAFLHNLGEGIYLTTELKKMIFVTEKVREYDEDVKNILAHKIVLAHILAGTVDEFKGMEPEYVKNVVNSGIACKNHHRSTGAYVSYPPGRAGERRIWRYV